jgi:hypothetical protein
VARGQAWSASRGARNCATIPWSGGSHGLRERPGRILQPVRQGNAFEETVERLLTVIKLGMIPDGDRFPPER